MQSTLAGTEPAPSGGTFAAWAIAGVTLKTEGELTGKKLTDPVRGNLHVEHWAVGFLDLLGQRAALRKMDFLPDTRDQAKVDQLIEAVKGSVGVIREFHRLYEIFREARPIPGAIDPFRNLPAEAQQLAREWRSCEIRSTRFSDGLMVCSSLVRSSGHSPVRAVYELIGVSGTLMLMSLAMEHPIRGGLDVGTATQLEDGQLHGPAVVKAYELESISAEYPRIVVGTTLADYLRTKAEERGDLTTQYDAQLARSLREMLSQDADGLTIVDYMGKAFKDNISNVVDRALVHKAQHFAEKSLRDFETKGDKKLADRYGRLVDYFDRRVDVWI
jgi:hypothetical protein